MDSHETFDPSKIAQAHKLLTGLDHDITKVVKMTSRIGAVRHFHIFRIHR